MAPYPDYPIPEDEEQRLRDLRRHGVLDTASDPHFDRIVKLASQALGMPIALVSLVDRDRQWFLARKGVEVAETPRCMAFCAHAIAGEQVLHVPDASSDARFNTNPLVVEAPYIRFYAGAPLRSPEGHNLGTLCVIDTEPHQLDEQQLQLLQLMADLVVRELELRRLNCLCPVTGMYNRSSFFRLGAEEFEQARSTGKPLALFNFDIDDFRQINNRWGHRAGDHVLEDLCRITRQHLKSRDLFGRIGDEEFAVLLVDHTDAEVMATAAAIRAAVEAMAGVFSQSDYHPLISGGVTSLASKDTTFSDLFYRADQALFLAKGNGRNQIARLAAE